MLYHRFEMKHANECGEIPGRFVEPAVLRRQRQLVIREAYLRENDAVPHLVGKNVEVLTVRVLEIQAVTSPPVPELEESKTGLCIVPPHERNQQEALQWRGKVPGYRVCEIVFKDVQYASHNGVHVGGGKLAGARDKVVEVAIPARLDRWVCWSVVRWCLAVGIGGACRLHRSRTFDHPRDRPAPFWPGL